MLSTVARAACAEPVAPAVLVARTEVAFEAWAAGDTATLHPLAERVREELACLDALITPSGAVRLHRLLGLDALLRGREDVAAGHLAAAARLDPDWPLTARDPVLDRAWALAQLRDPPLLLPASSGEGQLFVDGLAAMQVPSGRPTIVQLRAPDGALRTHWAGLVRLEPTPGPPPAWTDGDGRVGTRIVQAPGPGPGPERRRGARRVRGRSDKAGGLAGGGFVGIELGAGFGNNVDRYSRLDLYDASGELVERENWDRIEPGPTFLLGIGAGVHVAEVVQLRFSLGLYGLQVFDTVDIYPETACATVDCARADVQHGEWYGTTTVQSTRLIGGVNLQGRISPVRVGILRPFVLIGGMMRFFFDEAVHLPIAMEGGVGLRLDLGDQVELTVAVPISPNQYALDVDLWKDTGGRLDDWVSADSTDPLTVVRALVGLDLFL